MGLFRKKPPTPSSTGVAVPSNARTTQQWQRWEASRGCVSCGKKGCHRMNHSYVFCLRCGSAYCNGDACPGRRRR
jgi:hypothetical protein